MSMVAPLTTALITSVPRETAGVASAVNNAISRVGPQLAGALIFVAIASSFYSGLAQRVPTLDTTSKEVRIEIGPLNRLPADADPAINTPQVRRAVREASTDSYHLAMLIAAGLLFLGAAVNGVGIRNPRPAEEDVSGADAAPEPGRPAIPAGVSEGGRDLHPLERSRASSSPCAQGPVPTMTQEFDLSDADLQ
jgi:hypothetical protein